MSANSTCEQPQQYSQSYCSHYQTYKTAGLLASMHVYYDKTRTGQIVQYNCCSICRYQLPYVGRSRKNK